MNPELLSMSNEELIQWASEHGGINPRHLRKHFSDIETYCARHTIGVGSFIESLVRQRLFGIALRQKIANTKEANPE